MGKPKNGQFNRKKWAHNPKVAGSNRAPRYSLEPCASGALVVQGADKSLRKGFLAPTDLDVRRATSVRLAGTGARGGKGTDPWADNRLSRGAGSGRPDRVTVGSGRATAANYLGPVPQTQSTRDRRRLQGRISAFFVALGIFATALFAGSSAGAGGSAPITVEQAPPSSAKRASYGDLVRFGDSRLLALSYSFPPPGRGGRRALPSAYFVAEPTLSGRLVGSFGRDGYTMPVHFGRRDAITARANAVVAIGRRIVVAGVRETQRGTSAPLLVAYRADGRIDRSFGRGGVVAPQVAPERIPHSRGYFPSYFADVGARPGGGLLAVGVIRYGERQAALVAAYHSDGTVDRSFGRRGRVVIPEHEEWNYGGFDDVLALPNGKILLAGPDDVPFGRMKLMRLTAGGRRDRTFGSNGVVKEKDPNESSCCGERVLLASAADGKILLAGEEGRPGSSVTLLRLNSDGSRDRSFGAAGSARFPGDKAPPGYFDARAITVPGDGEILIVGCIEMGKRHRYHRIPAVLGYRADGKVDRRFGNGGVEILSRRGSGGVAGGAITTADGRTLVAGGIYGIGPASQPLRPFLSDLGASQ